MLRTTGISDVEAEELAILPGMEELSAMMYVNQYRRENGTTYRARLRADGGIDAVRQHADDARVVHEAHLPVPARDAEGGAADGEPRVAGGTAHGQLLRKHPGPVREAGGHRRTAEDPQTTSVRLVTNAERMVLRETQRAFVYFSLHGLTVDGIIVNRVLPQQVTRRVLR